MSVQTENDRCREPNPTVEYLDSQLAPVWDCLSASSVVVDSEVSIDEGLNLMIERRGP